MAISVYLRGEELVKNSLNVKLDEYPKRRRYGQRDASSWRSFLANSSYCEAISDSHSCQSILTTMEYSFWGLGGSVSSIAEHLSSSSFAVSIFTLSGVLGEQWVANSSSFQCAKDTEGSLSLSGSRELACNTVELS